MVFKDSFFFVEQRNKCCFRHFLESRPYSIQPHSPDPWRKEKQWQRARLINPGLLNFLTWFWFKEVTWKIPQFSSYRFMVKVEVVKGFPPKVVWPILSNFFGKILWHRLSYPFKETKKINLACYFLVLWQGDAVFWYNLGTDGHPDNKTRHAACPVIVGSKWGKYYQNFK